MPRGAVQTAGWVMVLQHLPAQMLQLNFTLFALRFLQAQPLRK
jgi:hypothetical protein